MKTYTILVVLLLSSLINAQVALDTIYANDKNNVALFFPKPIRQGITGASHFVFTYNREEEQYFGLLQATPGDESNLLAITSNGQVYSYILKYEEQLPELNYFIAEKASIGNERPKQMIEKKLVKNDFESADKSDYFEKFSSYLLRSKYVPISTTRNQGIKLQLQEMAYNGSEVYLVIEIKNRSDIDFEIDYLNISRINGNKKRKASYQKLLIKSVFRFNMPSIIKKGESRRFVFVLPKFVLGDNEKLQIKLSELKGSRTIYTHI